MFEEHVLYLLRKYLGDYVEGLSVDALRISVWKGDVVLRDLKLKAEALNSLRLPVTVKAGFLGTITLKVPWKKLGKEPVVVLIDRVYLLAHPAPDGHSLKEEDREKLFQSKLQQIEDAELAMLEASRRSKAESTAGGNSWLSSLVATIIGNLKVTISNVHVRYEDTVSNPGHPFCTGITLSMLAAVTTDEQGNETFDASGALDKLRKSLQLQRLAVYHDSNCKPWKLDKKWEDFTPLEWSEVFQEGIDEQSGHEASIWGRNRKYLVSPINGVLNYCRLGKQERHDPEIPFEKASLLLDDVSLTISEYQYYDGIKLLEAFSRYKTHVDVSHLRPLETVSQDPRAWWRYAMLACLQQKSLCYCFSWDRIRHLCQLRRRYVQLYFASLLQSSNVDISEIRQIERNLDSKVIILWRLLARAKLESVRSKEASQQKDIVKRSWWSFGWRSSDASNPSDSTKSQLAEDDRLTIEEWQAINKMLTYQYDEDITYHVGKDVQNMIHYLIDVSIAKAAAMVIDINETEVICGRFEQLHVSSKLYPKSIHCDVSLKYCGLSSPEGSLAESVISVRKANALEATFIYAPINEDIDWRLAANIAPCHVTVLMDSYERFLEFMKRSNAVSPTVAMETATVLQMKIEQVTRKAQEQIQMVLEDKSRFALDVDFDAPKVRIPMKSENSTRKDGNFILDFGHFTVNTREGPQEERQSLYSRFYISGRDMAAFFIDDASTKKDFVTSETYSLGSLSSSLEDAEQSYSLLDRCGMSVIVEQIKVPHPHYPSTRISIQVPNLGIHFSPERYRRILELMGIFYGSKKSYEQISDQLLETGNVPWQPTDLATYARILVWRGLGNSLAEWQPCYLILSGLYLYVLESETSHSCQRCCSMAGRQVFEVPQQNVGGSTQAIAVSFRCIDLQKALESSSTLIIEFSDYDEKTTWSKGLVLATYKASAPPSIDVIAESVYGSSQSDGSHHGNLRSADLVINGTVVETKLSVYGKLDRKSGSLEEVSVLELIANVGKVNIVRSGGDLTVKMKLQSLKIKDELQSRLSTSPKYLACSVLNNFRGSGSPTIDLNQRERELQPLAQEEDDCFKDALPDFISTPEHSPHPRNFDWLCNTVTDSTDLHKFDEVVSTDTPKKDKGHVRLKNGEIFYEAEDSCIPNFVALTFLTRYPDSPLYDGIDTQMNIRMSSLEFLCNRPTLVALIELGLDLSLVNSERSAKSSTPASASDPKSTPKKDESSHSLVKGLLGYGKSRVIFNLKMDVDSVCVTLNKEDDSQLAVFIQESFILDLKVHPSSTCIDGSLGNMILCDMSLQPDSRWHRLCDIRNQGIESLIKFTFKSYSFQDDDYEGYSYSLKGRLSAVRIVFLYRFVQEITAYLMELASPHTDEVIQLVDKVGGFEWFINKYEIDGGTAVKLDLSLDTPIIIIPKNSTSEDFMQLDLGQLEIKNSFTWHGCKDDDPSAVHLDVLQVEIHGINMAIGVKGVLGKSIIREGEGIHIEVRRSLRDVFRKVPNFSLKVQVGVLHGIVSDKEYEVIKNSIYMNISELPNLPRSFRGSLSGTKETIRMLVDKVNLSGQTLLIRTVFLLSVEANYVVFELCNGADEESPLAQIALEGLWVSYRTTSLSEMDLYVTASKFSVMDIRPDTKSEMRLMLGSYTDISDPSVYNTVGSTETSLVSNDGSFFTNIENTHEVDISHLTMLIMDYRWRPSFQSFVIRIQQPRILVVLDFLLAVAEFFVPAVGLVTGREESSNPKNDPLINTGDIIFSEPIYLQTDEVIYLSPQKQLIVDGWCSEEFIYDGCGGTISLIEEFDMKGLSYSGSIIIIGRGKRLRFKNVKIENGAILKKCTYLSHGSSISVSADDGVEISIDDLNSNIDNAVGMDGQENENVTSNANIDSSTSNQMASFTFEAQVISPEFVFYDCSKLAIEDSLNVENLLRAKMDISFMYASKENDTWARALVKDLTIEAGSGLVILEPVDIQGGYTSVKEKTNISLTSTDIYIHLSLSVASLILKLQNQAVAALQFGNINPLTPCTNFKRLWVSSEGNLHGHNLTYWRPKAPSNYVILGDCVTSRPIPPSQAVVAVSNTYGRVRRPTGFKLIYSFSNSEESSGDLESDGDYSLWMPIPPPGYTAVGCVVHPGKQPPPTYIVYCLRSDLVTSTCFSDCIYHVPANTSGFSGFTIWRVDNVINTFFAHNSVDSIPKGQAVDLHLILLRQPDWQLSLANHPRPVQSKQKIHEGGTSSTNVSGWDIVRSLSRTSSYYISTPHFERIWWDKGSDTRRPTSIWRPVGRPGFAILGDCVTDGLEPPSFGIVFKCDDSTISARPVQFTKVAHIVGKGLDEAFFWYPISPPGFASLGCIVTKTDEVPKKDLICCPRIDLVTEASISNDPVSRSSSSKGSNCWSIWKVENQACTFLARSDYVTPSSRLAYSISDYVKPKTRDNVTAEMKLGHFSLSILDSYCGTATPLFDMTITGINLATHGRLDAMNAVLICSVAASTFNRQLEAWEPLIEPFDAILKFESYDTNKDHLSKSCKKVRFAATTTVNLNVSAANLETLSETMVSWDRQNTLELHQSHKSEEAGDILNKDDDSALSPLDEEDFQKVIIENKIGSDLYLKRVDSENVELLLHDSEAAVFVPPPRFSDNLNVATKYREKRYYVAVEISESKELPIIDDGNSYEYFCALRLLIDNKSSDQYKLFPQSARTRCVRPWISEVDGLLKGYAKWNELFIFEVPEKGTINLEVEVTNLASKAGKGEVLGTLSIPIGTNSSTLKRAPSVKLLQQAMDSHHFKAYPLNRKGQKDVCDEDQDSGFLVLSTSYIEQNADISFQSDRDSTIIVDRDVGFWIGVHPDGPWEGFSSVLPLTVVPKSLDKNLIAFELVMRNGKRHGILRSLAMIVNDTDAKLEVSLCPASVIDGQIMNLGVNTSNTAIEEIFENQRYQPISGWANKSSSNHANDPGRWSTRDFSYSSKDFFEPALPNGWKWSSAWKIDRSSFVDTDGWAYGADFQSFKWPPSSTKYSSKSALDFVRRRRWIRTRKQLPDIEVDNARTFISTVDPGSSSFLPWTSLIKGSELCLQVRPFAEVSQEPYTWSRVFSFSSAKDQSSQPQSLDFRQVPVKSSDNSFSNSVLRLDLLEKKDMLLYSGCGNSIKQHFWLSVGTDASVIQTEFNTPVYDWRISINPALKLENKLPHETEYAVWEKTPEGNMVERQHGVISPGGSTFVYSADIRKPIYLTLFVQGGWTLEKDAILIMDLAGLDHASSFWMVQQQSNRRLRVSIERDMGGSDAAPKLVRFFVPYWIQNDADVPLVYRIVEVEPVDNGDTDSLLLSRVKSAKHTVKNSSKSFMRRHSSLRKSIQVLEVIEDFTPKCVMLSPQDYVNRGGIMQFQTRADNFVSARIGISFALRYSQNYSVGISLLELETKERVDFNAFSSDGSYFRLSAQLKMSSDRTKVVQIIPRILFINRIGRNICLAQSNNEIEEWLKLSDPPKPFKWQSHAGNELLKLRLDGYNWSTLFSIENVGIMRLCMKNEENDEIFVKVEVRNGTKSSRYEAVFGAVSLTSPYRIENRSMFLPIRIRQVNDAENSWQSLPPNSAIPFFWQDLGRRRLLEILVDGNDPSTSVKYNIDEVMDHQPMLASHGPNKALRVTIQKEGKIYVCRISDWMPQNESWESLKETVRSPILQPYDLLYKQSFSAMDSEFHLNFDFSDLGLSIIDHMPEEILYLSVQNLQLSLASGLDSGISRYKFHMQEVQVDNQLPFSPMPVLFKAQRVGEQVDFIIKFQMTMQTDNSLDFCVYPYIGFQVPDNSAFLVNIHEPIIWRLHEMFQQVKLDRILNSPSSAVSVDPTIKIRLLNISEIRFKVSMSMAPSQRPRGVLGFWSSLMTALGNMEHMPVRIAHRFREELSMRQSSLASTALSNIKKDLLSQPLQLLSGVDILGNASSALSNMSKGVAALSMDKKFIQSRQKQDSKGVEDIGDVIREGGGALAKGLFRGVTGILTKPLEGAKTSGVQGFAQGVGKGLIGVAAQPVSGVLDLLSKTTEGANAVRMKISSAITSEEQLIRKRLPRVIGGDSLLRPYDEYKAKGQAILHLAESGSFFGQVDLFKVRGKFALSDAYEDHFLLPKGKIFLVTHRRVLLLQQPISVLAQRKFDPAKDACSVIWDVLLDDLVTMELTRGKKDQPGSLPSCLILYLKIKPTESKESIRVIKCSRGSHQACDIYSSIQETLKTYGPNAIMGMQKRKVRRPYTPNNAVVSSENFPKEVFDGWLSQDGQVKIAMESAFGSVHALPE